MPSGLRFDEAFLSTFGRAFDRAAGAEYDRQARSEESGRTDARLDKSISAQQARDEARMAQAERALADQNRRFDEAEKNRAERENRAIEAAAKRYQDELKSREADRAERGAERAAAREDAEYSREYQRALGTFQNSEPTESAATIRPLYLRQVQGGALSVAERARLDAGRDAYAVLRKLAATPRTVEQTVKRSDPTNPLAEVYEKVRIPDPTWKPVHLPPFEQAMTPDVSRLFGQPSSASFDFGKSGSPTVQEAKDPLDMSGAFAARRNKEYVDVKAKENAEREQRMKQVEDIRRRQLMSGRPPLGFKG